MRGPRGYGKQGNLRFLLMGIWECGNFSRELGIKVTSGEQFGISSREQFKRTFGNKGDFRNFSREHGSTDTSQGASSMAIEAERNYYAYLQ